MRSCDCIPRRGRARRSWRAADALPWALALALPWALPLAGCGNVAGLRDAPLPAEGAADAYWALAFRDHAINLSVAAPTNTVQLTVSARTADGRPVPGVTAAPTYTVQDPEALTVSPTGVLTAHAPATDVWVAATWSSGGVTHTDTAHVRVTGTAPVPPLATFSIQPPPGDSAKWSARYWALDFLFGPKRVIPVALDVTGQPIPGLLVAYTSSRPRAATVNPDGTLHPNLPGTTVLTASTYAYGVRTVDSLPFIIGLPTAADVVLGTASAVPGGEGMRSTVLTVGVGVIVTFRYCSEGTTAVVFDDSARVSAPVGGAVPFLGTAGGNIASLDCGGALREFDYPGVYQYRDGYGHVLGNIIVQAD